MYDRGLSRTVNRPPFYSVLSNIKINIFFSYLFCDIKTQEQEIVRDSTQVTNINSSLNCIKAMRIKYPQPIDYLI